MDKTARTPAADYRLGLILVTAAALAWSTAGLFTRLIEADTGSMLFWRGLFGGLGIFAVSFGLQGRQAFGEFARLGVAGWGFAIISGAGMLCFITALRLTTVAHVAIIYATVPLVAAALGWLVLRERLSRGALMASLVALVGVAIMVGLGRDGALLGDVLAFGMTLALAAMMVISRRIPTLPIMAASALSAGLSGLAALPFAETLAVSSSDMGLLIAFGLVNSALGLALFSLGARYLPAVETALITALDAPLAPVWVWIVFAETPGRHTFLGGGIVLVAVAVHLWRQNRSG
ncbi:EamA/RhaT family transporter [Sulfitobacter sp. SK012]|uniref:DMT family transporter n=1 Tax=Sulfitobacter sp. SK012 TaxID=1389005 RepID=UPI000E0BE2EB|nr:DMT family transporter [Sulfitobacter sp. SK012]AXI48431.1 EamA/RhaT family transporter [Sulfitobacter sp. SK012]